MKCTGTDYPFRFDEGDVVGAVWAQSHSGPGWSNRLIYVLIHQASGGTRIEALQPSDHTREMRTLFPACSLLCGQMRAEVDAWVRKQVQKEKVKP